MKKIFYCALLFIGAVAALYYAPVQQDSVLYGLKSAVVEMVSSTQVSEASAVEDASSAQVSGAHAADLEQVISRKKEELVAYEEVIAKIDAADEQMRANGPICPTTGERAITTMTRDPRPELRDKIEKLEYEIADLESRI